MKEWKYFFMLLCCVLTCFFVTEAIGGEELEVLLATYGHVNEGTWDPAGYKSILKAQEQVPFKLYLHESVDTQNAEKTLRNWAAKGIDVITIHSDMFIEQILKVSKHFPNSYFIGELDLDPELFRDDPQWHKYLKENSPKNFILIGNSPFESNYLAGYAAALVSKNGKIGIVQPFTNPYANRWTNSFVYGARAAKPDIDFVLVNTGDWLAPAATRDAVKSLAEQNCDIVFVEMDDNSGILECAEQGIYCIPMHIDKLDLAPDTVVTTSCTDWSVMYSNIIKAVKDGKFDEFREKNYFMAPSVRDGSNYLGKWGPMVSDEVKQKVAEVEAKIKDGTIKVPIDGSALIHQ